MTALGAATAADTTSAAAQPTPEAIEAIYQSIDSLKETTVSLSNQIKSLNSQIETMDAAQSVQPATGTSSAFSESDISSLKDDQEMLRSTLDALEKSQIELVSRVNALALQTSATPSSSIDNPTLTNDLEVLKKNQQEIIAALSAFALTSSPSKETNASSTTVVSSLKKGPGSASNVSVEEISGQQYIRLKVIEDGQEVELYLDPMYVDMNLVLNRSVLTPTTTGPTVITNTLEKKNNPYELSEVMDYLSSALSTQSSNTTHTVSNTYSTTQEQPSSIPASPEQKPPTPSAMMDDTAVINELHRAQKLFYSKKYNAALNAVQRSLDTQETDLGYALEGSIYFTLGDIQLAIASWEKALALNPDMPEVKRALFKYKR